MKKTLVVLGLVAVMFIGASYVYARGPGFGPGSGSGAGPGTGNCPGLGGASNLTPEQQTQMRDLQQKHYNDNEVAPLREKMANLKQELRTLWANPNANPGDIQTKTKEMSGLRDQMQEKMIQFRLEARNLLTPDQISAFGAGCGKGGKGGRGCGSGRGCN